MRQWHRVRDGTLPFSHLAKRLAPLQAAFRSELLQGVLFFSGKARALCRDLWQKQVALWRFTKVPGVEPTNNAVLPVEQHELPHLVRADLTLQAQHEKIRFVLLHPLIAHPKRHGPHSTYYYYYTKALRVKPRVPPRVP